MKSEFKSTITCSDGYVLSATIFEPTEHPIASVIIASAMGVRKQFYNKYATYLAQHGFRVLTFDYRGTFESSQLPENAAFSKTKITLAHWAAGDVSSVIKSVYDRYERAHSNIFYVGHSIGGQLLTLVDHDTLIHVRAFIGVAAQSGYFVFWPLGFQRLTMIWNWFILLPFLTTFTFGDAIPILNVPPRVVEQWYKSGRRADYIYSEYFQELLDQAEADQKNKKQKGVLHVALDGCQDLPTRFYCIENDPYAPQAAVKDIYNRILQTQKKETKNKSELVTIKGEEAKKIGHFGFFSDESVMQCWWKETTDFMKEHLANGMKSKL